jgi:hypothetical protein
VSPLTPGDRKRLRAIYRKVGGWAELKRQTEAALRETPSRGRKEVDTTFQLFAVEMLCRTLQQQFAVSRTAALRQLVRDMQIPGMEESTIARLSRKLGDPDFQRRFEEKVVTHYPRPTSSQI